MALAYENGSLKGNESDDVNGDDDVFGTARIRHSSRKSKVRMPIANRPLTSDGMDPIPKNYLIRSIAHYDSALSLMHRWSDGAIFIDPNMYVQASQSAGYVEINIYNRWTAWCGTNRYTKPAVGCPCIGPYKHCRLRVSAFVSSMDR
ncbi:hypothetical protein KEM48_013930 [Puccinia striiformis f. sp. tritici PST-130]|nr:hypothetical protein H4Q26_015265 [Puccinia striiformis f. sp. tritici PST-130]KAI9630434.1 hypothetical protein KEM48_013930 [Puccinia striiformis f. sp. tritici PST-130]